MTKKKYFFGEILQYLCSHWKLSMRAQAWIRMSLELHYVKVKENRREFWYLLCGNGPETAGRQPKGKDDRKDCVHTKFLSPTRHPLKRVFSLMFKINNILLWLNVFLAGAPHAPQIQISRLLSLECFSVEDEFKPHEARMKHVLMNILKSYIGYNYCFALKRFKHFDLFSLHHSMHLV